MERYVYEIVEKFGLNFVPIGMFAGKEAHDYIVTHYRSSLIVIRHELNKTRTRNDNQRFYFSAELMNMKSLLAVIQGLINLGDDHKVKNTSGGLSGFRHPTKFTIEAASNANTLAGLITEYIEDYDQFEWRLNGADLKLFATEDDAYLSGVHLVVQGDDVFQSYIDAATEYIAGSGF